MFAAADLIVVTVIEDGLRHLAANPDHLQFILTGFQNVEAVRKLHQPSYIKDCIEFVTKSKITVKGGYEFDITKFPAVCIVDSQTEGTQFIGDYGSEEIVKQAAPETVATFDVLSVSQNVLKVSASYKLEDKIWPNIYVTNSQISAQVTGIYPKEGQPTELFLNKDFDPGITLKGWRAETLGSNKGYTINSSIDNVNVQLFLNTAGDYSIHRLLRLVIRYCLKRGRLILDNAGIQTSSFSQSLPQLINQEALVYQTTYGLTGKLTDSWIEKEFNTPDPSTRLDFETIVCDPAGKGTEIVIEE